LIVRRLDGLVEHVLKGYKPYYHRGVKGWHLKREDKRVLIERSLDGVTEEVRKALEDLKRCREAVRRAYQESHQVESSWSL